MKQLSLPWLMGFSEDSHGAPLSTSLDYLMVPRLIALLCLLVASSGVAQRCYDELLAVSDAALTEKATGLEAAELLREAVELLEPALPQLYSLPVSFSLLPSEEGYTVARFLKERGLLPELWEREQLTPQVWQEMLNSLRDWYDLPSVSESNDLTHETLIADLTELIALAAPKLRPVALLAPDGNEVAFWAITRNDSIYPRIIIYQPGAQFSGGTASALELLASCTQTPSHYLSASARVAEALYAENVRSDMYIVGAQPATLQGFTLVPDGEELAYLSYEHEATADWTAYSVVFAGKVLGPVALMRLLPRIRTNMSPKDVLDFAQGN